MNKNGNNKHDFPEQFQIDGCNVSDKETIASKFNIFFGNIGLNVANNIGNIEHGLFKKNLNNPCFDVLIFKPVEEADVIKIIDNLSSKNSCGIDKITTKLLKTITQYITKSITFIINQSLLSGVFPEKLKIAKIVPIFKKYDPTLFDNYRPIFSKIFERVIFDQLHNYFDLHNLNFESQYGFRKKTFYRICGFRQNHKTYELR